MSHESERPADHTIEFLELGLADTENNPTPAARTTRALIEWHLGTSNTIGEDWDTAHDPKRYGLYGADLTALIGQNDAARQLAYDMITSGEFALAERTLDLILPSATFEPGNNLAITRHIEAELAHHGGDLDRETEARRMANISWQRASNRGEPINAELYVRNTVALEKCERRLWERDHPTRTRVAAVLGPAVSTSASELGIKPFSTQVLPEEASDAAKRDKGVL